MAKTLKRVAEKIVWGFTKLADYEDCPLKFKFKNIDRLPDKPGPAMLRGTEIHEIAERFVKLPAKRGLPFPPPLSQFEKQFIDLRERGASTEAAWGFDVDWNPLPDWFHPETWVRIKADSHYTKTVYGFVIDYKTGRFYPKHDDQLNLYAVGMLKREPTLKHVVAQAWYLDNGATRTLILKRSELAVSIERWNKRVSPMYADKTFGAKPNPAVCKWCPYAKSKGGPCKYA